MKYLKLIVGIGFILAGVARADDGTEFFEKKIRPVMVERCYECHSATAKKLKGKFRLDTKEDFEKGGETGAAVVPGDPEKSLLIKAVRYQDNLHMPPKGKLDADKAMQVLKGLKLASPRGALVIDPETRDPIQTVYVRRVEKLDGHLYNVEFDKFADVKDPGK